MSHPPFDASRAVTFDLAQGQVHLENAPRRVLVPADALARLCASTEKNAVVAFARAMGESLGQRLSQRLGEAKSASIEVFVDHLGGELALLGLGSLSLERWGRALVFVMENGSLGTEGDSLLSQIIEAALATATGRSPRCVVLDRAGDRLRLLVVNEASASKVMTWLDEGTSFGDVLIRLHEVAPRGEA